MVDKPAPRAAAHVHMHEKSPERELANPLSDSPRVLRDAITNARAALYAYRDEENHSPEALVLRAAEQTMREHWDQITLAPATVTSALPST